VQGLLNKLLKTKDLSVYMNIDILHVALLIRHNLGLLVARRYREVLL